MYKQSAARAHFDIQITHYDFTVTFRKPLKTSESSLPPYMENLHKFEAVNLDDNLALNSHLA